MCGIIGYVGPPGSQAASARTASSGSSTAATTPPGIALLEEDGLDYVRAVGNLQNLKVEAGANVSPSTRASGTRAGPRTAASPSRTRIRSTGCDDAKLAIVLNGIVENYRELRERAAGRRAFASRSETDAEVVAHLLERALRRRPVAAVRAAYAALEGHFAFVVIHRDHPSHLVGVRPRRRWSSGSATARTSSPRTLAAFLSRDAPRAVPRRRRDRLDHARRRPSSRRDDGEAVEHEVIEIDWDDERSGAGRATRPSCSRRSTSSPRASPRRSATASATASWCSRGSA